MPVLSPSVRGRSFLVALAVWVALVASPCRLPAAALEGFETPHAAVHFGGLTPSAALQVADLVPHLQEELAARFGWRLSYRPTLVLLGRRADFVPAADHPLSVAFAVPSRGLAVIDVSSARRAPFRLESTLKHELCHLLLHAHVSPDRLPRWLDEGLAQWASDDLGEMLRAGGHNALNRAAISGTLIPLRRLRRDFPADNRARVLAYDQSRSFIQWIAGRYGPDGLRDVLENLTAGADPGEAFLVALDESLESLELEWRRSLKGPAAWLYLGSRLTYELLFPLAALVAAVGFVRVWRRRRRQREEMPDDE